MGNQLVKLVSVCKKSNIAGPKKTALKWKHNGLRHSFVSYRIAVVQNENQIAMEAGNSPAMIHQHYRELVTVAQAKEWFSIVPASSSSKIVQFTGDNTSSEKPPLAISAG
jgi:hypothetical protein